ncbi:Sulfotransferase 2A1 [Apodemus speciosus]|uniref:Sulfotransferase n=1 Tax=Apodemus speciosus TaxID=105296 RepID=A0ABQ0EXQ3_APOSI
MMTEYTWFEGIAFSTIGMKKENLEDIRNKFVVKEEDLILLTYPKSGTNWLVEIVCLIQTRGDPKWIQSVPTWERSPWLESNIGYSVLINKEGPRLMTSHLPFQLFSRSLFSSKAKVIYAIRNPRDVLVSAYFFWGKTNLVKNPGSLETYFEWFLKGNEAHAYRNPLWIPTFVWKISPNTYLCPCNLAIGYLLLVSVVIIYGSWFEHVCDWLSMREHDNFLVLYYEDMKKDTMGTIKKICDFLGKKLGPDELDLVIKYSSFEVMKENNMSNFSLIKKDVITNGLNLMRKGTTGDWKNHFTVAQAEAFDKVFQEKMAGFPPGIFPWE